MAYPQKMMSLCTARAATYLSANVPFLSWSVNAEPDYYNRERVVGELGELTYELVEEVCSRGQNVRPFCRRHWRTPDCCGI